MPLYRNLQRLRAVLPAIARHLVDLILQELYNDDCFSDSLVTIIILLFIQCLITPFSNYLDVARPS